MIKLKFCFGSSKISCTFAPEKFNYNIIYKVYGYKEGFCPSWANGNPSR